MLAAASCRQGLCAGGLLWSCCVDGIAHRVLCAEACHAHETSRSLTCNLFPTASLCGCLQVVKLPLPPPLHITEHEAAGVQASEM